MRAIGCRGRSLRPVDRPQDATGAFAAADWMFNITPGIDVSASAAASLRFGYDQQDRTIGDVPECTSQQHRSQQQGRGELSELLVDETDPASRSALSATAEEPPDAASEQRGSAQQPEGDDATPPQLPRRRVSFVNRLPTASTVPRPSSGAAGGRAAAEWVAAQVITAVVCTHRQLSLRDTFSPGDGSMGRHVK